MDGFEHPRIALVVGVEKYKDSTLPYLYNPLRNVDEIAWMLRQQGRFQDVKTLENPTRDELLKAVYKFRDLVSRLSFSSMCSNSTASGCVALFYFAGHMLEDSSGQRYLLPSNWEAEEGDVSIAVKLYGCSLVDVLSCMMGAFAGMALLDASNIKRMAPGPLQGTHSSGSQHLGEALQSVDLAADPCSRSNLLVCHSQIPETAYSTSSCREALTAALLKELCNPVHSSVLAAVRKASADVQSAPGSVLKPVVSCRDTELFSSISLGGVRTGAAAADTFELAGLLYDVCKTWAAANQREAAASLLLARVQRERERSTRGVQTGYAKHRWQTLVQLGCIQLLVGVLQEDGENIQNLQATVCTMLGDLAEDPSYRELLILQGAVPLLLGHFLAHRSSPESCGPASAALEKLLVSRAAKVSLVAQDGVGQLITSICSCCTYYAGVTTLPLDDETMLDYLARAMRLLAALLSTDCYNWATAVKTARSSSRLKEVLSAIKDRRFVLAGLHDSGSHLVEAAKPVEEATSTGIMRRVPEFWGNIPGWRRAFVALQVLLALNVLAFSIVMLVVGGNKNIYLPLATFLAGFLIMDPWSQLVFSHIEAQKQAPAAAVFDQASDNGEQSPLLAYECRPSTPFMVGGSSGRLQLTWGTPPKVGHHRAQSAPADNPLMCVLATIRATTPPYQSPFAASRPASVPELPASRLSSPSQDDDGPATSPADSGEADWAEIVEGRSEYAAAPQSHSNQERVLPSLQYSNIWAQ